MPTCIYQLTVKGSPTCISSIWHGLLRQISHTSLGANGAQALRKQAVETLPAGNALRRLQTAASAFRHRQASANAVCARLASQQMLRAPSAVSLPSESMVESNILKQPQHYAESLLSAAACYPTRAACSFVRRVAH
jgi:hypothetical protein